MDQSSIDTLAALPVAAQGLWIGGQRVAAMSGAAMPVTSPIDGRHITNADARREDLARSGCIEYDPEMRKDTQRQFEENEKALDSSVDAFVEEQVEKMPSAKRERLGNELAAGTDAEIVRLTAGG